MGAPKDSWVKRARMSASAGPYLLLAGVITLGLGATLTTANWSLIATMAIVTFWLQFLRKKAWLEQNDALEFAALAIMPIVLIVLIFFIYKLVGAMNIISYLFQGFGGAFTLLGIYHIIMKKHTLALADKIEKS